jgi:hypothetical protein
VADAGTYQQVSNVVDAPRILANAIEQFKAQRTTGRTDLASALVKDLATAPLNVESAINREKAWKTSDETLVAKIEAADELKEILEKYIGDLKTTQPDVLRTVLHAKVDELEAQVKVEHEEAEVLREQIKFLRSLLHDVNASQKQ